MWDYAKMSNNTFRYLSSEQYLEEAIANIEKCLGQPLMMKKIPTPTLTDFHPKLDQSPLLNGKDHEHYQSLIGILRWLVALGRIDIQFATTHMAQYAASPRRNQLHQVYRIFGYLKTNP